MYIKIFEFLCIKIAKVLICFKYSALLYTCNEGKVDAVNDSHFCETFGK